MIHPDTYVQHTPKGLGLFARKRFLRGEILWIIDDIDLKMPLLTHQALDPLQQHKLNIYCYLDYQHRVIVPWDEGKYVNHSCAPNSTGLLEYDNISIALRDIEPGEEIVEDYYCYYGHFETFTCKCGAPNCRGTIDQVDSYRPDLRLRLDDIAPDMMNLDQPLLAVQSAENESFLSLLQRYSIPV